MPLTLIEPVRSQFHHHQGWEDLGGLEPVPVFCEGFQSCDLVVLQGGEVYFDLARFRGGKEVNLRLAQQLADHLGIRARLKLDDLSNQPGILDGALFEPDQVEVHVVPKPEDGSVLQDAEDTVNYPDKG